MPRSQKIRAELRDLEKELNKYSSRVYALEQRKNMLANQLAQTGFESRYPTLQEGRGNESMINEDNYQSENTNLPAVKSSQMTVKQHIEQTLGFIRQRCLVISQLMQNTATGIDSLSAALSVMEAAGSQIQQQLEETTAQVKMQLANASPSLQNNPQSTPQNMPNPQDLFGGKNMDVLFDLLKSPFFAKMLGQLQSGGFQQKP